MDDDLFVMVMDNGKGLPEGESPSKLSDPYVTHKTRGTGLGLAIVKKIMTDHHGRLIIGATKEVQSHGSWEDLGGATVTLKIPVGAEQDDKQDKHNIELKKTA